jgi:hypothetical protein
MMKKVIYYFTAITAFVLTLPFNSCSDLLDPEALSDMTKEDIITRYGNTESTLNALYSFLPNGLVYIGDEWERNAAMLAGASDEAEFTLENNAIQKFNTGAWNAIDNPDPAWKQNFEGINAANSFLVNIDSVNLDNWRYSPSATDQDSYQRALIRMPRWKYEARFLRAFFYFELVKRYGGVPLIKEPISVSDNYVDIPRSPLSDCIQFIVAECDSAADHLPGKYMDSELGRITKGAALALKSRVLLYAASDLFNDPSWASGYSYPELISLTGKSREDRWREAAEAAAAVITLKTDSVLNWYPPFNSYSLYNADGANSYENLFKPGNSYKSNEVILARRMGNSASFELINYPIGFFGGNSGITPSRNLVDAYAYMAGSVMTDFDWTNPAHTAVPFDNLKRDRRLNATILFNNAFFGGADFGRKVQAYTGGVDGKGVLRATKTGFYLKKYLDPELSLVISQESAHAWIIFRLAEIYLNYAEAVNEIAGPNGSVGGAPTAMEIMDMIRRRAFMPSAPWNVDQNDFKAIVRYERHIELAFEDHRLWDLRRWMEAEKELSKPLDGLEITMTSETPVMIEQKDEFGEVILDDNGNPKLIQGREPFGNLNFDRTFEYKPITVESRVFRPHMYLYPIPQKELKIANGWAQNPGW